MIPNMKFYVISIVSIFAALGIGIYIGFTLDAQSFVLDQREDIALKLEERFDFQKEENKKLKLELLDIEKENELNEKYIDNTYNKLVGDKLVDKNILVIETNADYMYSGIGKTLEDAGANLSGLVSLKYNLKDIEKINKFYKDNSLDLELKDPVIDLSNKIMEALLNKDNAFIARLKDEGLIDIIGYLDLDIDTVVMAGGSFEDNLDNISKIDKTMISYLKDREIGVIGVEKTNVKYSYMEAYKNYKISTVDNIDTVIGKVSMVYALDNKPGNYGIKPSADGLMPTIDKNQLGEEE